MIQALCTLGCRPFTLAHRPPPSPGLLQANPRALAEIDKADAIVYGMGSLYTSVCPILCLDGMGEMIATREVLKVSGGGGGD